MTDFAAQDDPRRSAFIDVSQLQHRPIGPGELASLRALWWRQAALGHHLPAERGVILLEGGSI